MEYGRPLYCLLYHRVKRTLVLRMSATACFRQFFTAQFKINLISLPNLFADVEEKKTWSESLFPRRH